MITYNIRKISNNSCDNLRLGFNIWAKNSPKDYLRIYPESINEIKQITGSKSAIIYALVDDVWPMHMFSRTNKEQEEISSKYISSLLTTGFHDVRLVSDLISNTCLGEYLFYANRITISEFYKLLPQSKKINLDKLTLIEVIEFFWHTHLLEIFFKKLKLTGFLAGIRSELFYLMARKILPPHDVYFVNTS